MHDEDEEVRVAVAEQGYGLEQLVHDTSPLMCEEVAMREYGLVKLIDDEDAEVRHIAKKVMALKKPFDASNAIA